MADTARLFLALWPPAPALAALREHQASWHWPASARLTPAERMHVTLHFIGAVALDRVDELCAAFTGTARPFALSLDDHALWRGGIAVVSPSKIPQPLAGLHMSLAARLEALGLPVEQRPFRPHVTLARHAQGAAPPQRGRPIPWEADGRWALVQSQPGGAGYRSLRHFG